MHLDNMPAVGSNTCNQVKSACKSLICVFTFLLPVVGCAQAPDYKREVDIIFQSQQKADYALIKTLLDPQVKIGDLPTGMNDMVVPQVLAQLPKPDSYTITGVEKTGTGTRVRCMMKTGTNGRTESFLFNSQGKITDLDIISDATTETNTVTETKDVTAPAKGAIASPGGLAAAMSEPHFTKAPLELKLLVRMAGNLMYVRATVDGVEGDFIIDSGAPGIVLNSKTFSKVASGNGVGGAVDVGSKEVRRFSFSGFELADFKVPVMDLAHLEAQSQHKLAGLIGANVFKDYEIVYDLKNKSIQLFKVDANGAVVKKGAGVKGAIRSSIPVTAALHLPLLTMEANGKAYRVVLDCGAAGNLLRKSAAKEQTGNTTGGGQAGLSGANQGTASVTVSTLRTARVGGATLKDMLTVFDDANLQALNAKLPEPVDGILGYEFLKQNLTAVNMKKGELRFYER